MLFDESFLDNDCNFSLLSNNIQLMTMFMYPERLLLQCSKLESVHASGCQELLIGTIESQVR